MQVSDLTNFDPDPALQNLGYLAQARTNGMALDAKAADYNNADAVKQDNANQALADRTVASAVSSFPVLGKPVSLALNDAGADTAAVPGFPELQQTLIDGGQYSAAQTGVAQTTLTQVLASVGATPSSNQLSFISAPMSSGQSSANDQAAGLGITGGS